jgi:hypothetical protein
METQIINPSEELKVLIKNFVVVMSAETDYGLLKEFTSEEYVIMSFDFRHNKSFLMPGETFTQSLLALESENMVQIDSANNYPQFFIVVCFASVFSRIFNVNDFASSSINKIFDNYPMLKSLKDIVSVREKVRFFENYILNNTSVRKLNTLTGSNPGINSGETELDSEITPQEVNRTMKINNIIFHRSFHLKNCLLL